MRKDASGTAGTLGDRFGIGEVFMVLKWKQFFLIVLIISLIITGCSNQRTTSKDVSSVPKENASENNKETSTIPEKDEQKVDVLETYKNKDYNFLFDIPVAWNGKYKVLQKDNRISFIDTGWPDFEPEVFAIVVMTEEEFKKANAEATSIPEQDILGRRNNLVYFYVTPLSVPLPSFTAPTKVEDFKEYDDEWLKLFRALNQIPKRFHFE